VSSVCTGASKAANQLFWSARIDQVGPGHIRVCPDPLAFEADLVLAYQPKRQPMVLWLLHQPVALNSAGPQHCAIPLIMDL
jgi:hypothetical protein